MQIVTGRRGEPHVTSRQMQAVYRSFLGDFALLDIGEKLRAEAYSNDIVRVYDGVVSVQGIYAVIAYNQYDEVYIEPVSVGKKRIDTIVLHYTKDNTLDVEDMQLDVVQGEEYTDNPIAPVVPEGGDAWEGTTDIQVPIYDVEVTNFGLTVTPYARMLNLIPTLESIAERIPETVVTGVKGDSEVLYRDGDVNITKANIGLGNVDNTADTDKPISTATQTALNFKADLTYVDAKIAAAYHAGGSKTVAELTSALLIADNMGKVYNMSDSGVTTSDFVEGAGEPINEGDNVGICNVGTEESPVYKFDLLSGFVDLSAYYTKTESDNKYVAKETGKGLSTEDYTTTEKTKLAGISEGATQTIANPADTATETLSKLEVGGVVYDVPQGASGATELSELTDVNLSNVEDNDILQFDETANKWKNSNALQGTKTTSGNPLTIEDAAPVNAVNLSMDLEPVQDLHGYDYPWVGGAGKNKLPMTVEGIKAANTSGTWSGNVYTVSGGTFTIQTDNDGNVTGVLVNGTFTGTAILMLVNDNDLTTDFAKAILGNTITLNGCPKRTGNPYVQMFNTWGTTSAIYDNGTDPATLAVPSTISGYRCDIVVYEGTVSNVLFKPMIRLSTESDATFAPYTNICPISGRSEVVITDNGINQWDEEWELGSYDTNGGVEYANNKIRSKSTDFIKIDKGEPFYFECTSGIWLCFYTSAYQFISATALAESSTVNPPSNAEYIRFNCATTYGTTYKNDIFIGKKKLYTIQLGETVYGGQLDVTRGKMVVNKGSCKINELEWTTQSSEYANFKTSSKINEILKSDNQIVVISELYIARSNRSVVRGGIQIYSNSTGEIKINDTRYSTTTDFINAVGNSVIVYELATPYTIQLTPQQIKMLENTNTLSSDGNMALEYQPNNAIGEAVRVVEESYDAEFAVRPPLKKIAFSGTTDSDGSVTLINASDIPSNHRIIPLQITDMTIGGSAGTYFVEYKPYNSGDSVKGYCYTYFNGSQITPVGTVVTGNFYYYELEV